MGNGPIQCHQLVLVQPLGGPELKEIIPMVGADFFHAAGVVRNGFARDHNQAFIHFIEHVACGELSAKQSGLLACAFQHPHRELVIGGFPGARVQRGKNARGSIPLPAMHAKHRAGGLAN